MSAASRVLRLVLMGLVVGSMAVSGLGCDSDDGDSGGGAGGEGGASMPTDPNPEIWGLVGRIIEPNLEPVRGGTVYLIPSSDVAALAETPVDLFLSPSETAAADNDEPIEDLIEANGSRYEQAAVDSEGSYRFESLPEGDHFVVWFPEAADPRHLPGGDYSRVAFGTESLIGMQLDIRVSARPSSRATYVGSSTCMVCHGLQSTTRTPHNVGLQVPGVRSSLQDVEPWPEFDDGLDAFEAATDLFFHDCDPEASGFEKCVVSDTEPSGTVSFEARLRRDTDVPLGALGAYYVELENRVSSEGVRRYDVMLTYGGTMRRQQYLTRRSNLDGTWSYFVLPLQFNHRGDPSNPDPSDWPWRDYRSDQWFDFDDQRLAEPPNPEAFDNNCAGCHFTGYELVGSDASGWSARATFDPAGAFDYDGDGRTELINVGCESCHGPGSEHLELGPRGSYIISPGSLTPGREAAMCGSCHSRPIGIGAGPTGLPLSADDLMPPPGLRRPRFAVDHTTRVSGAPDDFFDSGDPLASYQQYSDFIRSAHYRNPTRILSCTSCHSAHANFDDVYGPAISENLNPVCTVCHSSEEFLEVLEHVAQATSTTLHDRVDRELRCTECHMVPTARSGAAVPALLDVIPSSDPPVQRFWNDVPSHRLTMTDRGAYEEQPVAATNECAPCHGGFFPNQ